MNYIENLNKTEIDLISEKFKTGIIKKSFIIENQKKEINKLRNNILDILKILKKNKHIKFLDKSFISDFNSEIYIATNNLQNIYDTLNQNRHRLKIDIYINKQKINCYYTLSINYEYKINVMVVTQSVYELLKNNNTHYDYVLLYLYYDITFNKYKNLKNLKNKFETITKIHEKNLNINKILNYEYTYYEILNIHQEKFIKNLFLMLTNQKSIFIDDLSISIIEKKINEFSKNKLPIFSVILTDINDKLEKLIYNCMQEQDNNLEIIKVGEIINIISNLWIVKYKNKTICTIFFYNMIILILLE